MRCAASERYPTLSRGYVFRKTASRPPYDVVFADPPYQELGTIEQWSRHLPEGLLAQEAVIVVEHARKDLPASSIGRLSIARTYAYGDTALSIYRASEVEPIA